MNQQDPHREAVDRPWYAGAWGGAGSDVELGRRREGPSGRPKSFVGVCGDHDVVLHLGIRRRLLRDGELYSTPLLGIAYRRLVVEIGCFNFLDVLGLAVVFCALLKTTLCIVILTGSRELDCLDTMYYTY